MGEYADMAVDDALNGYWDDPDDDDPWGFGSRRLKRRRRKLTNQEVFKRFAGSLEDVRF